MPETKIVPDLMGGHYGCKSEAIVRCQVAIHLNRKAR